MNETETNIKHGYSLMVRDARGAIWNPGAQISKAAAGAEFMPPGQNAVLGTSFPTPGVPFLPKMSYFQSRGHNFD